MLSGTHSATLAEILDKFVGEAERRVRALFEPAEEEWATSGDDSALHVIILDEMDAIARKRQPLNPQPSTLSPEPWTLDPEP